MTPYKMHVFDCDGVLIKSNSAKSFAYFKAARSYGVEAAHAAVRIHQTTGSLPRRVKWERIFTEVLQLPPNGAQFEDTLTHCDELIAEGVAASALMPGVVDYLDSLTTPKMVVSGVQQPELGHVLETRGLADYFDQGAFGGSKTELLPALIAEGRIQLPAVYYGDTRDDWQAARSAGMDFVLVTADAEWDWQNQYRGIAIDTFVDILPPPVGRTGT